MKHGNLLAGALGRLGAAVRQGAASPEAILGAGKHLAAGCAEAVE